ncbi:MULTISPECIES: septum formation initiator family protein [unclassified Pseudactinotalea]|uniref:septum formation initiator family protein n=1 Tax=unclassified Pseudactinotalea TaxID=2649176 RepID=UPI00128D5A0D|nr:MULTISPECIES: septum formation initiator family protein [unclassified Pseudactinotalea]MPV49525.1 hypothetical protein [Pseudactinotalea sp. HY160]QGH69835.1 hypothetical protein GCE65_10185 [Pseudactinotalea sp. HY158]
MTAARAVRAPATRPSAPATRRPKLRLVHAPAAARSRVPFFLLCITILGGAMLVALMLNTSMAATAYDIHSTEVELARLSQTNQELATEVDELSAPARLARRATELGMVRSAEVSFIRLADGSVVGPKVEGGGE